MRRIALILVFLFSLPWPVLAAQGQIVRTIGVAPLLGPVWSVENLQRAANSRPDLILAAVKQAGHRDDVAQAVLQILQSGAVQDVPGGLPHGIVLQTMGWYDGSQVRTLYTPQLATGSTQEAWAFEVQVTEGNATKVITWVLPKRCGNLSRLKVTWLKTPPPTYQPPPPTFQRAEAPPVSVLSTGGGVRNIGGNFSSFQIGFHQNQKPPVVNVRQVTAVKNGNKISLDNSNTVSNVNENTNNNANFNNNQNNNNATSQAQNVTPVNVLINTGSGNVDGSATGTGQQGAGVDQNNGI